MNKYTLEVSITGLCVSCGDELKAPSTEVSANRNEMSLKDRRVFFSPCPKCFIHIDEHKASLDRLRNSLF